MPLIPVSSATSNLKNLEIPNSSSQVAPVVAGR